MKNIRIGNDIKVEWSIFKKGGGVFLLDGLDLIVNIKDKYGCKKIDGFTIAGNVIRWTFKGKDQHRTGIYSLELVINKDEDGMITTDACQFVNLVSCTCDVGSDSTGVHTESIELRSSLIIGGGGEGGGSYDDTAIWEALNDKVDKEEGKGLSTNDYTDEERQKLAGLKNYDDTKLKKEIAETYATKEYVNEAVGNAGGGGEGGEGCECATPDWSAPEGKEGHILNRTHYKDVEILENGGLKTNDDGEPISPNYIRFRNEYGNLSDLILVDDYADGSYIDGVPLYDEYEDSVDYIHGTLIFQPDNWTIEFTPEGDGIYYVDSVYESLKQLDEEFIPDTIARKSELTELNELIEDFDSRLSARAEETTTLQENKADKSELTELSAEVGKKQDTIPDLEAIRSGASKGATALQSVPDTYATKTYVDNAINGLPTPAPSASNEWKCVFDGRMAEGDKRVTFETLADGTPLKAMEVVVQAVCDIKASAVINGYVAIKSTNNDTRTAYGTINYETTSTSESSPLLQQLYFKASPMFMLAELRIDAKCISGAPTYAHVQGGDRKKFEVYEDIVYIELSPNKVLTAAAPYVKIYAR